MDVQNEKFNELFDFWVDMAHKENVKNFGSLMANALKESLIAMKEVNKNFFDEGVEFAQKVAVPEGLNYKQLYKLAIINSKIDESKPNWAHVVSLGVGSSKAKEILRGFNIDPEATDMRKVVEAQEQSQ